MSNPKEKMGYITSILGVATVCAPIHTSLGHVDRFYFGCSIVAFLRFFFYEIPKIGVLFFLTQMEKSIAKLGVLFFIHD
jgi:hypothetical protein